MPVSAPPPFTLSPSARAALDTCVHCGFCLPSCPTYRVLENEADSPRGRISLMGGLLDGSIRSDDPEAHLHLSRCLDCRTCESVCPSAVAYGRLIEDVRAHMGTCDLPAPLRRGLAALLSRPHRLERIRRPVRMVQRLGLLHGIARRTLGPEAASLSRAVSIPVAGSRTCLPPVWEPPGLERGRVTLLLGCMMDLIFPRVNWASAALLVRAGFAVRTPRAQGCCGALHLHVGERDRARALARELIDRLGVDAPVIVNSAGCASAMKGYGDLLADDPAYAERAARFASRVQDLTEFLDPLVLPASRPMDLRVTYADPCHLAHAQGIRAQPRRLLERVGLAPLPLAEPDSCCGAAGVYNLVHPDIARPILERKLQQVAASGADTLVTANPGCHLQLMHGAHRHGWSGQVYHVAEVLAAALGEVPPAELGGVAWPQTR